MNEIAAQILAAADIDALAPVARRIEAHALAALSQGVPVGRIATETSHLNLKLFQRLWVLLVPPAVQDASCLVVMGSEGRGEQILKTDQDNGLVLRDGFDAGDLAPLAARFNDALAAFGYPPCPGHIMLTNPVWRQSVAGYRASIRDWLLGQDLEGPMRLAIFFDAAPAAGDESLLAGLRSFLFALASDNDAYLARFAGAADQFHEPVRWWAWITGHRDDEPLDVKKLGIFPIVHGVRALALQGHVADLGTAGRLQRLADQGRVSAVFARELLDALHRLMAIRLAHQLSERAAGRPANNEVRPSALAPADREGLRDALDTAKRFRAWLRQHFRFGMI